MGHNMVTSSILVSAYGHHILYVTNNVLRQGIWHITIPFENRAIVHRPSWFESIIERKGRNHSLPIKCLVQLNELGHGSGRLRWGREPSSKVAGILGREKCKRGDEIYVAQRRYYLMGLCLEYTLWHTNIGDFEHICKGIWTTHSLCARLTPSDNGIPHITVPSENRAIVHGPSWFERIIERKGRNHSLVIECLIH
jgi:hypothetical protein